MQAGVHSIKLRSLADPMPFNDDETVENIPVYVPEDPVDASLIEEGDIEIGARLIAAGCVRRMKTNSLLFAALGPAS